MREARKPSQPRRRNGVAELFARLVPSPHARTGGGGGRIIRKKASVRAQIDAFRVLRYSLLTVSNGNERRGDGNAILLE
ncbi:hypothetical protein [Rhizobium chutanense]|uniref:hypothetical protein n=1 Tax=Rhizobium chutanense TaxID=2035448 RepID=UPI00117A6F3E|nr:hypothetical protein [Rhizobium chutanense]